MAVNKAIRADDVSGLNIATTQFSDTDAVTKDFQRVVINNSTDGTMATVGAAGLKVDPSGATSPVSIAGTVNVRPSDGTNPVTKTFDSDTGAGTEYNLGVSLRKGASGGSVEAGTASDPIRTDPTGTTNQPISASSLPLPSGASTSAKQPALGTAGSASADVISIQGIASMTPVKTDGSATTQPVSGTVTVQQPTAANLKVDLSGTGANSTAIKTDGSAVTQPVSGTITANQGGTWTVQPGNTANTTAWKVDGSAVTQPVSGTVTANIGTTNGLALDATLTGGTAKSIVRGGAKGSTTAADVTSTASGANRQPLDVALYDASGNQVVPGQALSASSLPVVVASDQTPINVLAAVIPVVTYSSFILADSNSVLWTTTMSDAGVLVTSPSPSGSVATTIFLNDVGAHTSYQVTVSTLGVIVLTGVTYNAGYQTILGFTTTSGYQSALYIGGGALLSRTPAAFPRMGLPTNAAQETGGNLALITALLQNEQKTVDLLERILACLEAHKLMFADVGAGYVDTDETIKNIQ